MRKVTYSNRAKKDFLSIWAYIAEDSPNAADRLLDTIKEKCERSFLLKLLNFSHDCC